jgi:hypothetical protein
LFLLLLFSKMITVYFQNHFKNTANLWVNCSFSLFKTYWALYTPCTLPIDFIYVFQYNSQNTQIPHPPPPRPPLHSFHWLVFLIESVGGKNWKFMYNLD